MNPLPYLPALVAAIAAAICGVVFALSAAAWILCEPADRIGRYRPRPGLFLVLSTALASIAYLLLP